MAPGQLLSWELWSASPLKTAEGGGEKAAKCHFLLPGVDGNAHLQQRP